MKYKKCILANLISHEPAIIKRRAVLRAGLGYIGEILSKNGINYKVVDLALGGNYKLLISEIEKMNPDFLGISLFTYRYYEAYSIIKKVKKAFPELLIICGGPHVSAFKTKVIEECPAIDSAIRGEADKSIVEFIKGKKYSNIEGFIWKEGGKINFNPSLACVQNLDELDFPRYTGFKLQNYPLKNSSIHERIIPVVTSRGCPYECMYCTVKLSLCRKFRFRSVGNIMRELKYWHDLGYRKFSFVDDNFTLIRKRVEELCDSIILNNLTDIEIGLTNGIRADKVDFDLLKKMKVAGFKNIGIGVESGSDKILKALKKGETLKTIEGAIENALKVKYDIDLYFLIGSPSETEKEVLESINFASKYDVNNVFYFNLIPYPGTELFEWVKKKAKFIYSPEYYLNKIHSNMDEPVFETKEFPYKVRKEMLKLARKSETNRKSMQYFKKLKNKGIPEFMAKPLSKLYGIKIVQFAFNDISLLKQIKERIKK